MFISRHYILDFQCGLRHFGPHCLVMQNWHFYSHYQYNKICFYSAILSVMSWYKPHVVLSIFLSWQRPCWLRVLLIVSRIFKVNLQRGNRWLWLKSLLHLLVLRILFDKSHCINMLSLTPRTSQCVCVSEKLLCASQ